MEDFELVTKDLWKEIQMTPFEADFEFTKMTRAMI